MNIVPIIGSEIFSTISRLNCWQRFACKLLI